MQRLDIDDLLEPLERAPARKLADRVQVGSSGINVPDIGREVLDEAFSRRRIRGIQRRHGREIRAGGGAAADQSLGRRRSRTHIWRGILPLIIGYDNVLYHT